MQHVELPPWLSGFIAVAVTALTTWWLTFNERKKRKEEPAALESGAQVVAATFTERGQMERLTTALVALELSMRATTECNCEILELLKADAQRRHDEAVVRAALRERGIVE